MKAQIYLAAQRAVHKELQTLSIQQIRTILTVCYA